MTKLFLLIFTGTDRVLIVENTPASSDSLRFCLSENSIDMISELINQPTHSISSTDNVPIEQFMLNNDYVMAIPPVARPSPEIQTVRQNLPVWKYRANILNTIEKSQVCVISGETGKK